MKKISIILIMIVTLANCSKEDKKSYSVNEITTISSGLKINSKPIISNKSSNSFPIVIATLWRIYNPINWS